MHGCCGTFYCYTRDDLDDYFRRLQPNDLNLDLLGITHLDHESEVTKHKFLMILKRFSYCKSINLEVCGSHMQRLFVKNSNEFLAAWNIRIYC